MPPKNHVFQHGSWFGKPSVVCGADVCLESQCFFFARTEGKDCWTDSYKNLCALANGAVRAPTVHDGLCGFKKQVSFFVILMLS